MPSARCYEYGMRCHSSVQFTCNCNTINTSVVCREIIYKLKVEVHVYAAA